MKKLVMFDMDGVLFDSMPVHSRLWKQTFEKYGISISPDEIYIDEGMAGPETVKLVWSKYLSRDIPDDEAERVYNEKSAMVRSAGPVPVMKGAFEAVSAVVSAGVRAIVVTGSAQESIMSGLNKSFPGLFDLEKTVCANDVARCKPDPQPYLMGLAKAGISDPSDAIVVENAPMGVQSGRSAGCKVLAVNTGILPDSALWEAGADAVFPSMYCLSEAISDYLLH